MGTAQYPRFTAVLEHYGLATDPFGDVPDPGLFYPAAAHSKILDSLVEGIEKDISLQAITGDAGVGKTTLLQLLLDRLRDSDVILHRQPKLSSSESLKYLLSKLGITSNAKGVESLRDELIKATENKRKAGKPSILLIDDAQNLRKETLTILHSLSPGRGSEKADLKLILAALEGSFPTLNELCAEGDRCRKYQLRALSPAEIGPYIEHRLRLAGYKGPLIFTPGSVLMIAEYSDGVPRLINIVCSEALRRCTEASGSIAVEESCVRETIALLRNPYNSEALQESDVSADWLQSADSASADPAIVTEELERWFLQHEHSWSGTIGELLLELQGQPDTRFRSDGSLQQADLFLKTLHENFTKLAADGISVSIRSVEGGVRAVTLHRTKWHSQSQVKAADSEVETLERKSAPQEESSPSQETLSRDPSTCGSSMQAAPITDDDPEIFKRGLLDAAPPKTGASRSLRTALVLLIAVILAALALFWVRRTIAGQAVGNGRPEKPTHVRAVTVSDNPQSTLLGLLRSAEMGDSGSQLALATLYQSGDGIQKDNAKAAHWLLEAATHGEKEAAYRLANLYRTGDGVPSSKIDAYCWYVLAAQAGHHASEQQIKELTPELSNAEIAAVRYQLGQMSLRGVGTKADPTNAFFWFQLADAAGHPGAKQAKEALLPRMNQQQVAAASDKAARWLQTHPPTRSNSDGQAVANQR